MYMNGIKKKTKVESRQQTVHGNGAISVDYRAMEMEVLHQVPGLRAKYLD